MSNWKKYKNGNYTVSINLANGTKIRENDLDNLTPAFAENCDCKITDRCDGGCEFCYEGCTPNGKHGDILNPKFLDTLHPYTELAINGNDLSHPDLIPFLEKLKEKNVITNMTVNQIHFERKHDFIKELINNKLIYGLGVSLKEPTEEFINLVKQYPNAVIHTINGVTTLEDYKALANHNLKILILGYKELQRGIKYMDDHFISIKQAQANLYGALKTMIDEGWFNVVSFDNLAIAQLDVKRLLNTEEWDEFYMGDDSEYTFYLDLVDQKFSKNSIAPENERYGLLDSVDAMFEKIRKRKSVNVV
jgi:hypothetical protein